MTPVAAAAPPDMVSLLEQINASPGTWYAAMDPTSGFFLVLVHRLTRDNLLSIGKAGSTQLQFCRKNVFTLQPSVRTLFKEILIICLFQNNITLVHNIGDMLIVPSEQEVAVTLDLVIRAHQKMRNKSNPKFLGIQWCGACKDIPS